MYPNALLAALSRFRVALMIVATLLLAVTPRADAQHQHDTTKRATKAPATKQPAPSTKTKTAQTKTKSATTATKTKAAATATKSKAAPTKAPAAAAQRPAARRAAPERLPVTKELADTAHVHARDTVQRRDTVHAHTPDTTQKRDTVHAHTPDTTQKRDTAHAHMADTTQKRDTTHVHAPSARDTMQMAMSMTGPLGISMERMGSGTTWIPDAVMLPSRHFMAGKWMVMLHGFVFAQYDEQGGPRGASQFGSLNWAMIMADREVAGGRLQLRFMPSLDPATVGKCGYPLLLQSGETCNGQPLVDRQHPHDFFMELAALYERPISSNLAVLLYAAPAGEPALGPVAFMHRPSAMDEPQAPLGHHWQDATHISFGVVTAGLFTRTIRLEASAFNGLEPNEQRWDFDPIKFNSYSARLTLNPNANWSLTAGYGRLDNPERESPPESVDRFVASAMYGRRLGTDGQWTSTLIYGRNVHGGGSGGSPSHSGLAESEAVFDRHNTLFGRLELVQKSAHDLQLSAFPDERIFNVAAASLGFIRELFRGGKVTVGFGARGTVNVVPDDLEATYGSRMPLGGMVFLRLRPYHDNGHAAMPMGDKQHHGGLTSGGLRR